MGHIRGKSKVAGKTFDTPFAHILKIDLAGEKIQEFRVFNDSASVALSLQP